MLTREQHEELWELFRTYGRAKRDEGRYPANARPYAEADDALHRYTMLLAELTDPVAVSEMVAEDRATEPRVGDRVRLTYRDGSGCEGTWEITPDGPAVRKDDGTLHTHVAGHVRREVITRTT